MRVKSFFVAPFVLLLSFAFAFPVKAHSPTTCSWNTGWERYIGSSDRDNSFLVLELANQRLCLFQKKTNGKVELVSNYPVITGKKSTPTPKGLFTLLTKEHIPNGGITLRGSYGTVRVDYWVGLSGPGIAPDSIGLHNSPWHQNSQFLSTDRTEIGSRGCINVIKTDIAELFPKISNGMRFLIKD